MKHEDLLKRMEGMTGLHTVQHIYAKNNGGWCGHYIDDINPRDLKQLAIDYRKAIEKLEGAAAEKPIKHIWGGDQPYAIFLSDGTKITIGGNKQGCWLEVKPAAIVAAAAMDGEGGE